LIFKFDKLDHDYRYCILFLKNRNYIPVLCEYTQEGGKFTYAIRDCHENIQRNFDDFNKLRVFLDEIYQFEQMTIVDGVLIAEFSNIEFLVIEEPFIIKNIDPELFDHTEDKEEKIKEEESTQLTNFNFDHNLALSLGELLYDGEDYVNFI
jgi:hypothetical protein